MNNNTTIFLSSTFRDMHAERDIIHNIVLPELAATFQEAALHLDFVDLRWGIDTESEQDEQRANEKILEVCFDEIERSKPFFICFLGARYGWIPKQKNIESACLNAGLSPQQFRDKSITELEIEFAVSAFEKLDNCYFFFREGFSKEDISDASISSIYFSENEEEQIKVTLLKQRLMEHYPSRVFSYQGTWDDSQKKVVGLEPLGNFIIDRVTEALMEDEEVKNAEAQDIFYKEQRIQNHYFESTAATTVDRSRYTEPLLLFAKGESSHREAALIAPSGLGKSSLMAYVAKELEKEDITVLKISAGLTSNSLDFTFAIRYLYAQLTASCHKTPVDGDYTQVKRAFYSLLGSESQKKPIIILIDALNQFHAGEEVKHLDWINELFIPENVRIIYSTLPEQFDEIFLKRDVHCLRLEELDSTEIITIAEVTAKIFHKQLSKGILEALCEKKDASGFPACRIPLYLSMFIEYISDFDMEDYLAISEMEKTMGGAKAINEYILRRIQNAPSEAASLFDDISFKCAKHIGAHKNEFITTLLGQSRFGVREQDICEIATSFGLDISPADFSLYRKMFRMHLVQRSDGRWDFNHQALRTTVSENSCRNSRGDEIKVLTAKHFLSLPVDDIIRRNELMYYLTICKMYQEIRTLFLESQITPSETAALKELLPISEYLKEDDPKERDGNLISIRSFCEIMDAQTITSSSMRDAVFYAHLISHLQFRAKSKEDFILLAETYYVCGAILLKNNSNKYGLYFDLCQGLLRKKAPELLPQQKLRISDTLTQYGEHKQALKLAKPLLQNMKIIAPSEEINNSLSPTTTAERIKQDLSLGDQFAKKNPDKATALYTQAVENARLALIEKEELPLLKLYQASTERLAYHSQNGDLFFESQRLCKKLYYMTDDIAWSDKRIELIEDSAKLVTSSTLNQELSDATANTKVITETKLPSFRSGIHQIAHRIALVYLATAFLVALIGMPIYHTLNGSMNFSEFFSVNRMLTFFEEFMQWFLPPLMALGIFQLQQNISEIHKNTVGFLHGKKQGLTYGLFYFALLCFTILFTQIKNGLFLVELTEENINLLLAEAYYYLLNSAIVVCLVWLCAEIVRILWNTYKAKKDGFPSKQEFKVRTHFHRYGKVALKRVLLTAIPALILYIGLYTGLEFESLTYWGSKLEDVWNYHWVPFVLELIFSLGSLVYLYVSSAGTSPKARKSFVTHPLKVPCLLKKEHGKLTLKGVGSLLFVLVCTALLSIGGRAVSSIRDNSHYLQENGYYYQISGDFAVIRGYYGNESHITLPQTLGGKTVTTIGKNAFCNNAQTLISVVFSEHIETVEKDAFGGCYSLEVVEFNEGLQTIKERAFMDCTALESINLPDSVTSIGIESFQGCGALTTAKLSNQITTIPEYGFSGCTALIDLTLPSSLYLIDDRAFSRCSSLETVELPEGLHRINNYAFSGCSTLKEITLPASLKEWEFYSFNSCDNLKTLTILCGYQENTDNVGPMFNKCQNLTTVYVDQSVCVGDFFEDCYVEEIIVSDNVSVLPYGFAAGVSTLKSVSSGKNVTIIQSNAFQSCTSLERVSISEKLTEIGEKAFDGCSNLTELNLPETLVQVGNYAFRDCTNLKMVNAASLESWCAIDFANSESNPVAMAKSLYIDGQLLTDLRVTATDLGNYTFAYNEALEKISISKNVKSIAKTTFKDCPNIKIVNIEDVAAWCSIELSDWQSNPMYPYWSSEGVFYRELYVDSKPAEKLVIPEGVTEIAPYTFFTIENVKEVHLPSSLTSMKEGSFESIIPKLYIKDLAAWLQVDCDCSLYAKELYLNNSLLTEMVVPEEITELLDNSIASSNLTKLTLHKDITSIGHRVFSRWIKYIELPSIEDYCKMTLDNYTSSPFQNSKNVYFNGVKVEGTLVIPDTVTSIGPYAFAGLQMVDCIILPKGLTDIHETAFENCTAEIITAE